MQKNKQFPVPQQQRNGGGSEAESAALMRAPLINGAEETRRRKAEHRARDAKKAMGFEVLFSF